MIIISHKNKLCQVIEPELLLFAPAAQAMLFVLLFAGKEKKAILGFGTQDRFPCVQQDAESNRNSRQKPIAVS